MGQSGAGLLLLLAISCHDNLVHSLIQNSVHTDSLLITLYDVQDMIGELRQDIAHKIGHVDNKQGLRQMEKELQSISLESLPLTKLTVDVIQSKMDSATLHIKEVMDNMTDLRNLQKILHRLKELEFEMKELAIRIEEELEAQESDSTSTIVLQQEIAKLADELKQQQQKEINRQRPYEVIEGIQTRQFQQANDIMNRITEDVKIRLIIRTVYDHEAVNFDLLTSFARFLTNKTKTYIVTKVLRDQLIENNHNEAIRILELKKIADSIAEDAVESSERKGLEDLKEQLKTAVVRKAKDEIKLSVKEGDAETKAKLKDTLHHLYVFKHAMFDSAMKEAIDEEYWNVEISKWLQFARDSYYIEQIIMTCTHLWGKMKQLNELSGNQVADLGFTVKEVFDYQNYPNVKEERKQDIEKLKSELPLSIKNAAFSDKVCFRNIKYDEFLYAAIDDFKKDEDSRRVFSWNSTDRDDSAEFKVERTDDQFYFKSRKHNEYMFAAFEDFVFDRQRSVYTWTRGDKVKDSVWLLEPEGDLCYIKNKEYNEYLIGGDDNKKYDNDRRRVFTAVGGKKSEEAKWRIEVC